MFLKQTAPQLWYLRGPGRDAASPLKGSRSPGLLCSRASLGPQPGGSPVTEATWWEGEKGRECQSWQSDRAGATLRECGNKCINTVLIWKRCSRTKWANFTPFWREKTDISLAKGVNIQLTKYPVLQQLPLWWPANTAASWAPSKHCPWPYLDLDITRSI